MSQSESCEETQVSHIAQLLANNAAYAHSHVRLGLIPKHPTIIITCIDSRTAPEHFLGLDAGEALVLRNVGGRVTPEVEYQLGMLCHIIASNGGPQPEILIIHHTDCGMQRLTEESQAGVNAATSVPADFLRLLPIDEIGASLATDARAIEMSPHIPDNIQVFQARFDTASGLTTLP